MGNNKIHNALVVALNLLPTVPCNSFSRQKCKINRTNHTKYVKVIEKRDFVSTNEYKIFTFAFPKMG